MTHDEYLVKLKEKRAELRSLIERGLRSAIEGGLALSMPQGVSFVHDDEECTLVISHVQCSSGALFVSGHIAAGGDDISRIPLSEIDTDSVLRLYEAFLTEAPAGVFSASTFADLIRQLTGADHEFFLRHVSGETGISGIVGPFSRSNAPAMPRRLDGSRTVEYRLATSSEWKRVNY